MKKVLSVVSSVLVTIVLIVAILMTVLVITSTRNDAKLPNLGGYALMNVETDSMDGKNGFPAGSLIVIKLLSKEEANDLNVGDVITFLTSDSENGNGEAYYDTHRIVEKVYHGSYNYYTTQGDNTVTFDKYPTNSEAIVGLWTGTAIPHLGSVMKFLQSSTGFLICIVVPMAIFFIFELYKFIATLMENKKQKAVAAVTDAEDEIKQKAIAEYLAQQEAEKAAAAKKAENEPAPAPTPEPESEQPAAENDSAEEPKE